MGHCVTGNYYTIVIAKYRVSYNADQKTSGTSNNLQDLEDPATVLELTQNLPRYWMNNASVKLLLSQNWKQVGNWECNNLLLHVFPGPFPTFPHPQVVETRGQFMQTK